LVSDPPFCCVFPPFVLPWYGAMTRYTRLINRL
jgi:hypothetical protein